MRALTPRPHPLLGTVYALKKTMEALPTPDQGRTVDLCDAFLRRDPGLEILEKQCKDMQANVRRMAKMYSPGEPMFDLIREDLQSLERAYAARLQSLRAKVAGEIQAIEGEPAELDLQQATIEPAVFTDTTPQAAKAKDTNAWAWVLLFMVADEMWRKQALTDKKRALQNAFTHASGGN